MDMPETTDPQTSLQLNLNTFHSFSKTPVAPKAALSLAVNRSGHTLAAADILASELPFYSRNQFKTLEAAHKALGVGTSINDIVSVVEKSRAGVAEEVVYKRNETPFIPWEAGSTEWRDNWTEIEGTRGVGLPDGFKLYNSTSETPVAVLRKTFLDPVTYQNNSKAGSEEGDGYHAGRVVVDGKYLPFFLTATDKSVNGYPSLGFDAQVKSEAQEIYPTQNGTKFWVANSGGLVVFEEAVKMGDPAVDGATPVFIDCFEYTGERVSEVLDDIYARIGDDEEAIANLAQDLSDEVLRAKGVEGDLTALTTDAKGNLVSAVNEVDAHADEANATFDNEDIATAVDSETNPHVTVKLTGTVGDHGLEVETQDIASDAELGEEILRAKGEEKRIEEKLDDEITRAQGAEDSLKTKIEAEADRAKEEERLITSQLVDEIGRATSKENDILESLDEETLRAKGEERRIEGRVEAEELRADAEEKRISEALEKESEDARKAEGELDAKIDAEEDRAKAEEVRIEARVAAEEERAWGAED